MKQPDDLIETMVSIMRARNAGTRTVERAADVIAADARLNTRIGAMKGSAEIESHLLLLIEFTDKVLQDCRSIANQFRNGLSEKELCEKLVEIAARIDDRCAELA